jgi:hypothetical protein
MGNVDPTLPRDAADLIGPEASIGNVDPTLPRNGTDSIAPAARDG